MSENATTTIDSGTDRGVTINEFAPEVDLWDMVAFQEQKHHDWFKKLRAEGQGVHWFDESQSVGHAGQGPGFWAVCTYEPLREVNRDAKLFSSNVGGTQMHEISEDIQRVSTDAMMLTMDPPKHTRFRKLVNRGFTPPSPFFSLLISWQNVNRLTLYICVKKFICEK